MGRGGGLTEHQITNLGDFPNTWEHGFSEKTAFLMQNLKHFWLISWRKKANGNISTSYQYNSKKKFRLKGSMCPERSKIWEKHYTYMVARQWVFLTRAKFSLHAHLSTNIQPKPYIGFYYQSLYVFYNSCRCDLSNKIN